MSCKACNEVSSTVVRKHHPDLLDVSDYCCKNLWYLHVETKILGYAEHPW